MPLTVLHLGQSNAVGRGPGGLPFSAVSGAVSAWNNGRDFGAAGSQFVAPVESSGPYDASGDNNCGVWLCEHLAQRSGDAVRHVLVAKGSVPIDQWLIGGVEDGWTALAATWAAIDAVDPGVVADVFVWQGGESNDVDTAVQYASKFNDLILRLTGGGVIDADTRILLMPIAKASAVHIDAQHASIAGTLGRGAYVTAWGSMSTFDGVHWTGTSLVELGAAAYCAARDLE